MGFKDMIDKKKEKMWSKAGPLFYCGKQGCGNQWRGKPGSKCPKCGSIL